MKIRLVIGIVLLLAAFDASALVITEEYTTDFILLYSCGYYLSIDRHPDTLGTFANPQWNVLVDNEPVYVIAHGREGTIGARNPMDGARFAAWLGAPAWYTTAVYVASCKSAVNSQAGSSLIAAAADASRSSRSFTGYAGCAITDAPHGVERVVLSTKVDEMLDAQEELNNQLDPQGEIDAFVRRYRQTHGGADPPLLLLAKTAYDHPTIRAFFASLLKEGERQGCLHPLGQGIVTKTGKLP